MEIRNIQKTGKMHYVYLPTAWCKRHKIDSSSKVFLQESSDGSILISPEKRKEEMKTINLTLPSLYKDVLINLVMACYVNPASSFKISFEKKTDLGSLLNQKNMMSGLEFVDLDSENVTYESSMSISEPDALLKTMTKKIRNLLYVMIDNYSQSLIAKYEEEIDRSKILIQKSVISSLTLNQPTRIKPIELHYMLHIAIELERLVDYLIQFERDEKEFLSDLVPIIDEIKDILENISSLDYMRGIKLTKCIVDLEEYKSDSLKNANKNRIKRHLQNTAEVILDWAITKKIEN